MAAVTLTACSMALPVSVGTHKKKEDQMLYIRNTNCNYQHSQEKAQKFVLEGQISRGKCAFHHIEIKIFIMLIGMNKFQSTYREVGQFQKSCYCECMIWETNLRDNCHIQTYSYDELQNLALTKFNETENLKSVNDSLFIIILFIIMLERSSSLKLLSSSFWH